jgi:hypothetical protein
VLGPTVNLVSRLEGLAKELDQPPSVLSRIRRRPRRAARLAWPLCPEGAHLKRILRLDRLRRRGPCGARDEFLLAATAQNLRKLAKLITPPTPLPAT